ncbi:MAG: hypothetical protein KDK99_19930, partial [Verrucomicrobiales bacterium]|nr:hypothetical protein [Verrucomicrobiales bacterium]
MSNSTLRSTVSQSKSKSLKVAFLGSRSFKRPLVLMAAMVGSLAGFSASFGQTVSDWKTNANGNWSDTANWTAGVPNGVDDVANITFQISANRTITLDAGATPVTLGTLNIGDVSGGSTYTITGGQLIFDVNTGAAQLNMVNDGGNATISSAIQLNDQLDITVTDPSNSQGPILSGAITGGVAPGSVAMTFQDLSPSGMNWILLNNAGNTFTGQFVVQSGTLRYETNNTVAGAVGVGNETIALSGGSIDLRDRDFNISGQNDTEIFIISGFGNDGNGNGAIRNTAGTANLSHLILADDASSGGYSRIDLNTYTDASSATVYPIFDMGGNEFSKTGTSDFVLHNTTILNPGIINVREGEMRLESNSGSATNATILNNQTVNIFYNKNALDTTTFVGSDPTQGSRTSDPFNPNTSLNPISGNTVQDARLEFYWQDAVTHTGATINMGEYSALQRNGPTGAGQVFNTIIDATSTINLMGGAAGLTGFDINGGSGGYNSGTSLYDAPGALIIQGQIDNTSSYNTGTVSGTNSGEGFALRGNRTLQLENANPNFDGTVIIKQQTGRWLPGGFNTGNGALESQYANLHLAG